jgi:excisionase family DNA binding protein
MPLELSSDYMTGEQAADHLGVTYARVLRWIKQRKLPIAARSKYSGVLLRRATVESVGRALVDKLALEGN